MCVEQSVRVPGRRVAALHLRGMGVEEIAKRLGVDVERVSQELERLRAQWRGARDVEELRGEELMRLSLVEEQAWEAWERSRDATAESREERVESRKEVSGEKSRNQWRYLEIALKCSSQRRRLLGLDAAPRVAKAAETRVKSEQRERLGKILEVLRQRGANEVAGEGGRRPGEGESPLASACQTAPPHPGALPRKAGGEGDVEATPNKRLHPNAVAGESGVESGEMDHGQWRMDNDGREDAKGGAQRGKGSVVPRNVARTGPVGVGVVTIYKPEFGEREKAARES